MTFEIRTLRPTTLANKENILNLPNTPGRSELGLTITASIFKDADHNCFEVRQIDVELKVDLRIYFAYIRLVFSTLCQTSRGSTHYVGAQTHCAERCAASHAALTPTLHDSYTIQELPLEWEKNGLTPIKKQFLLNKGFVETELECMDTLTKTQGAIRNYLLKRLSIADLSSSFRGTAFGYYSHSTIHNPATSNYVDNWIEMLKGKLRNYEDRVNEQCYQRMITPEQGIEKIMEALVSYLESIIVSLRRRKDLMACFVEENSKITRYDQEIHLIDSHTIETDEEEARKFSLQLQSILKLLSLRTELSDRVEGLPTATRHLWAFRNDYFRLSTIAKDVGDIPKNKESLASFFVTYKVALTSLRFNAQKDPADFLKVCEREFLECDYQLRATKALLNQKTIQSLRVKVFGVYDEATKTRIVPNERGIKHQLLAEMTQPMISKKRRWGQDS